MTMFRSTAKVCPRCSLQVKGWLFNDGGLYHCLMCGYVLEDKGYRGTSFKELFAMYAHRPEGKQVLFANPHDDEMTDLLGLEEPTEPKQEVDDEDIS